ncbi:polycystin-1-like [Amphiura filiformis]|uniref:polycystin-1-like n=1 Tax=Amphiura filiformis TaxID=82378 RepID=UPI003B2269E0
MIRPRFKSSMFISAFVFLISFTLGRSQATDDEWVSCYMADEYGSEDTVFPFKGSVLGFHYRYPNVAPLQMVFSIDGILHHTFSASLPRFAVNSSSLIQEALDITETQQGAIGVGTHIITVNITYEETTYSCFKQFELVEPVTDVSLTTLERFVASDEKFKAVVHIESGFPCTIAWLIVDADKNVVFVKETAVAAKPSDNSIVQVLSSSAPGMNTINATVYNDLNYAVATTTILVEHPIKQVTLTSDSPMRYPDNTINFDLVIEDLPLPSAVTYDIAYGDGLTDVDLIFADGRSGLDFSHTYQSPGLYEVNVILRNKVSHQVASVKAGILEDIRNVSLLAYTRQNNYARPLQILPMEYAVRFLAEYDTGTVEYVTWEIESNSISTTSTNHWHQFLAVGWYNILATVGNTYTEESNSISIQILESVTSLYLVNNGPVNLGDNITYVLFCKQQGSSPSYKVDLGDGTEINVAIPQKNPNVTDYLPQNLKIPFDLNEYFSTVFSYLYQKEGHYVTTATGWNLVSHMTSTSEAFIQIKPCHIPGINIRDGGSNYYSPTKYKRNKAFTFTAKVEIDCQAAKKADYQWRIYSIDDIFSAPSAANEFHLPQHVNSKVTDLYIPKYLLDYGRYIFELNVVMIMTDGSIGISHRDQSYVEVVQSPLVAKISGGAVIDVGWSSNLTLDGSESFDPDWDDSYDGEYHWYCHLTNETLPLDIDVQQALPTTGGCLGKGMHLQSGNSSIMFIESETLPSNQTYIFNLAITKPGRIHVGWTMQTVSVMLGNPPALVIQCLHNCDSYMNPSERFTLLGLCTECISDTRNTYTWTLSSDSTLPVIHGQRRAFLSFPRDTFLGTATYSVKLRIDTWSGESSRAEYTFTTNSPPSQGNCSIIPAEGIVLETRFNIECHGFADPHGPLLYKALVFTGDEADARNSEEAGRGSVVYYGIDPIFPPTLLPLGQASNDFNVTIKIKVSDDLGASVYTSTFVKAVSM